MILAAMTAMAVMLFLFLPFQEGVAFTILMASLGLFFFSVMPIITAATMDQVERGSEGSATALIFSGGSVVGALSPIAAGKIFEINGFEGIVLFFLRRDCGGGGLCWRWFCRCGGRGDDS